RSEFGAWLRRPPRKSGHGSCTQGRREGETGRRSEASFVPSLLLSVSPSLRLVARRPAANTPHAPAPWLAVSAPASRAHAWPWLVFAVRRTPVARAAPPQRDRHVRSETKFV